MRLIVRLCVSVSVRGRRFRREAELAAGSACRSAGRSTTSLSINLLGDQIQITFALIDITTFNSNNLWYDISWKQNKPSRLKLEKLTRHETSSTVCLCLYSDDSCICYSTVTLNCDLLTPKFSAVICPIIHHWCKLSENRTITFQDIALTSPESAVSSILYSTVTLTFDLLTPNCEAFISVP